MESFYSYYFWVVYRMSIFVQSSPQSFNPEGLLSETLKIFSLSNKLNWPISQTTLFESKSRLGSVALISIEKSLMFFAWRVIVKSRLKSICTYWKLWKLSSWKVKISNTVRTSKAFSNWAVLFACLKKVSSNSFWEGGKKVGSKSFSKFTHKLLLLLRQAEIHFQWYSFDEFAQSSHRYWFELGLKLSVHYQNH